MDGWMCKWPRRGMWLLGEVLDTCFMGAETVVHGCPTTRLTDVGHVWMGECASMPQFPKCQAWGASVPG
jgi:hypothetical protein